MDGLERPLHVRNPRSLRLVRGCACLLALGACGTSTGDSDATAPADTAPDDTGVAPTDTVAAGDTGLTDTGGGTIDTGASGTTTDTGPVSVGTADLVLFGEHDRDQAGLAVAAAGDVDGDGLPDVLVGAPRYDDALFDAAGRAYLLTASAPASGTLDQTGFRITGEDTTGWAGAELAGPGDVNGDGFDDVLVGAWRVSGMGSPELFHGAAYLLFGPLDADNPVSAADITIYGSLDSQYVGVGLHRAGDLDGDGLPDLLVGAETSVATGLGQLGVFPGHTAGTFDFDADPSARVLSGAEVVEPTSAAGTDLDGDGISELVFGSVGYSAVDYVAGAAFVLDGPVTGDLTHADASTVLEGQAAFQYFGSDVTPAGDVDGDGHADLWISAIAESTHALWAGGVYLLRGPLPAGNVDGVAAAETTVLGLQEGALLSEVAGEGDLDGDGQLDLVVGAIGDPCCGPEPRVYVFLDPPSGVLDVSLADVTLVGEPTGGGLRAPTLVGDRDGDGLDDLAIGDWWHAGPGGGSVEQGAVYLFSGVP